MMTLPPLITEEARTSAQRPTITRAMYYGAAGNARVHLEGRDAFKWVRCAATVAACAGVCAAGPTPACLACAGGAYDSCKDCF